MSSSKKSPIFLSASIPYGDRAQQYAPDPLAVREAVHALIGVALPERDVVFGGHPAISPFVWEAARSLNRTEGVYIYQSEFFARSIPQHARYFTNLIWTQAKQNSLELSLEHMRKLMIDDREDETGRQLVDPYGAAFFLGGMNGTEEEWDICVKILQKSNPQAFLLPIASTQGAALRIMDNDRLHISRVYGRGALPSYLAAGQPLEEELRLNLDYRPLFRRLLDNIP